MSRKSKFGLWLEKGFTLRDRLKAKSPARNRAGIKEVADDSIDRAIERGDIQQELRLRYYPTIDIDFNALYAGTIYEDIDTVESMLYDMGYRNNPTAYVEVTGEYGPDDGSYARQFVTEDSELPELGIPFPPGGFVRGYSRVKRQIHVCTFIEDDEKIHITAHEESSTWLQPARHLAVSDGDGRIGAREFRDDYYDEFGEDIHVIDEYVSDVDVERPRLEEVLL